MSVRPLAARGLGVFAAAARVLLGAALLVPTAAPAAAPASAVGRAMVVAPQRDATEAGLAMLRAGGNAVDAAVATAFALAVTQPQSTGIGGGAFLLLRTADGSAFALDARETAPAATNPETFLGAGVPADASVFGGLAVGTPGFVAGMALALERFGTVSLAEVLEPAIRLAKQGYALEPYQEGWIDRMAAAPVAARFPETARIQLVPLGPDGRRLVQPELGRTLRAIARGGPRAFYEGTIAEAIAKAVAEHGGVLTTADLAGYQPQLRAPVRGSYRGRDVFSFPPPSSGGVALIEALNVLEGYDLAALGAGSSEGVHRIAEAMKLAFADRAALLGDPDFVPVPVGELTSKSYAEGLRARLSPPWWRRAPWQWGRAERALRVDGPGLELVVGGAGGAPDDRGTAHLSVVDAAGNAVALTSTINGPYGSWVTVPGTGILLNNEMDDFVTNPDAPNLYGLVGQGRANRVERGKRPLSSMTPTILVADGRPVLVSGSNGGPRIISSVLLSVVNVVDFGMNAEQAVAAPRFHHQWRPDELVLEAGFERDVEHALARRGHKVKQVEELSTGVQLIVCNPRTGLCRGAWDPRRDGLALGLPDTQRSAAGSR